MNEPNPTAAGSGLVIVVSAPSGGGKSSLCQRLLNWSPNIVYSVSCTTRAPRGGEQNGHDYFFLSTEEFEKKIAAGEFLEYTIGNENYYDRQAIPHLESRRNNPLEGHLVSPEGQWRSVNP